MNEQFLGLDLGQNMGWIKGGAVGPITSGTFLLAQTKNLGRWLKSSDPLFREILPGCTGIAIEQPFMGKDYFPIRKLLAMLGHVYYWLDTLGMDCGMVKEIHIGTGKKTLSGNGIADGFEMIAAAHAMGYTCVTDEHQAHAAGIRHVYIFGKREDLPKARTRSSKPIVLKP